MKTDACKSNKGLSLRTIGSTFLGAQMLGVLILGSMPLPGYAQLPAGVELPPGLELEQIPEAFRDLAAPQTTVADFYYGENFLASVSVTYTPSSVIINDLPRLLSRISTISRPKEVTAALSGEVFSNPALVCLQAGDTQCGSLNPKVAGVIFDQNRFRGDIFISPDYLTVQTIQQSKYLPASDSSFGMIQGLSAVTSGVTGSEDDDSTYSLFGNTLLGWRENHLVSNWDYSEDNSFQVDTLYLERDTQGMQMGAGYLDYSGLMTPMFAGGQQVLGLKIGSSMNSRLDMANVSSTPIRVFANGRRRVEVFRDNRLIYATTIEAGSQEIQTSSFPEGSYNVTIRLYNGSTLEQELTRFYTKSVRLPPSDEILWYLEGGELTRRIEDDTLPESQGEWVVRGGAQRRVTANSSLELRAAATDEEQTAEAELFYLGNGWDISLTGMVGSNSAKGAALQASGSLGPISVSYNHQRLWNDDYEPLLNDGEENLTSLLQESYESRSLSISSPFLGGNLTGSYTYNNQQNNSNTTTGSSPNDDDDDETIYSVSWFRNIVQFNDYDLDLELDFSKSGDNKVGTVGLTLRRSTNKWSLDIRGQGQWEKNQNQDSDSDYGYAVESRWYQDNILNGTGEVGVRYEDLPGGQKLIGGDVQYENARFLADLSADHIDAEGAEKAYTSYNGRIDTSFAINTDGAGFGGGNRADSAILVEVNGSPSDQFDVTVNGAPAGIAEGDSKTVVPLSPYGTYQVGIRPRGEEFYNYDQSERRITLYPGNVGTASFSAEQEIILLGKLVDAGGNTLTNITIPRKTGLIRTDQFGIFQLGVSTDETDFQVNLSGGSTCTTQIPKTYQKRQGVGLVGTLVCK